MVLICNNAAPSCLKAKNWLDEKGITYAIRDAYKNNPDFEELTNWQEKTSAPVQSFFDEASAEYRKLNLEKKLLSMDDESKLSLLSEDPKLLTLPILDTGQVVLIGFDPTTWEQALLSAK